MSDIEQEVITSSSDFEPRAKKPRIESDNKDDATISFTLGHGVARSDIDVSESVSPLELLEKALAEANASPSEGATCTMESLDMAHECHEKHVSELDSDDHVLLVQKMFEAAMSEFERVLNVSVERDITAADELQITSDNLALWFGYCQTMVELGVLIEVDGLIARAIVCLQALLAHFDSPVGVHQDKCRLLRCRAMIFQLNKLSETMELEDMDEEQKRVATADELALIQTVLEDMRQSLSTENVEQILHLFEPFVTYAEASLLDCSGLDIAKVFDFILERQQDFQDKFHCKYQLTRVLNSMAILSEDVDSQRKYSELEAELAVALLEAEDAPKTMEDVILLLEMLGNSKMKLSAMSANEDAAEELFGEGMAAYGQVLETDPEQETDSAQRVAMHMEQLQELDDGEEIEDLEEGADSDVEEEEAE